ncbi:MAG TPA: zinc ribbon domain-containing protein [Chthoniobacterales bacterium]
MTTTATIKLVCPECRRENEPERIYCHDCGARLDRSGLAKAKAKEEDPKATQRRLQSMLDPQRAKLRRQFFLGSKLVLGAVVVAGIVQMLRPPDLPPPSKATLSAQINLELENASMDPRVGSLRYSEEQVNAYLAYSLKSKQAALSKYLQFNRVVVSFEEGYSIVTVERSYMGVSVFATGSYTAAIENGAVVARSRGGAIGRLPVHPLLMKYGAILFADVRSALDREQRSIAKLGAIEFHPDLVVLAPRQPQS